MSLLGKRCVGKGGRVFHLLEVGPPTTRRRKWDVRLPDNGAALDVRMPTEALHLNPPPNAKGLRSAFTEAEIEAAVVMAAERALRKEEAEGLVTSYDLYRAAGLL